MLWTQCVEFQLTAELLWTYLLDEDQLDSLPELVVADRGDGHVHEQTNQYGPRYEGQRAGEEKDRQSDADVSEDGGETGLANPHDPGGRNEKRRKKKVNDKHGE